MWEGLQPELIPYHPHTRAHGREALRLQQVWESLLSDLISYSSYEETHGRKAL
ncbi:hypothetical protein LEMLEM_LOCUS19113 [Lemmus lemmus]